MDSVFTLPGLLGFPWLLWVFIAAQCVVIFVLAVAVRNDAEVLENRSGLFLVGPWMWFFIALLGGGYLPALGYWLVHYSSLRHRP